VGAALVEEGKQELRGKIDPDLAAAAGGPSPTESSSVLVQPPPPVSKSSGRMVIAREGVGEALYVLFHVRLIKRFRSSTRLSVPRSELLVEPLDGLLVEDAGVAATRSWAAKGDLPALPVHLGPVDG
jgi:hypothetical protein